MNRRELLKGGLSALFAGAVGLVFGAQKQAIRPSNEIKVSDKIVWANRYPDRTYTFEFETVERPQAKAKSATSA